jgi:hypothetical protein
MRLVAEQHTDQSNPPVVKTSYYYFAVQRKRQLLSGLLIGLGIVLIPITAVSAQKVTAGSTCKVFKQQVTYQNKVFTCIKKGKKLVWDNGVKVKSETQAAMPKTSNPSPTPISSSTPTPVKVLSISERWDAIDPTALNVARPLMLAPRAASHSVNFIWKGSEKADPAAIDEIKARYEAAAKFWAPFVAIKNPILVTVGNLNEYEWSCEEKHKWFGPNWSQPDCVKIQKGGATDGTMAGQSQIASKNIDQYLVGSKSGLDSVAFIPRVEHEFTHNVFHALATNYHGAMPCWMMESGAEYWGILSASGSNFDQFVALRNLQVQKVQRGNMAMDDASKSTWYDYLVRADLHVLPGVNSQGDSCESVRTEIYSHAILANEYLVGKVGLKGYLDLIKITGIEGWPKAVEKTFNLTVKQLYEDMAEYMKFHHDLVKANPFAHRTLQNG